MNIRMIRPSDHDALKRLHAANPAKYEIPDFDGKNFITGMVAVDEDDNPRALLCFERTAEAFVVLDRSYDVPAFRLVALGELIQAATPLMENLGYETVIGTIGPDIPRSYLRRLEKFGCEVFKDWTLVKMLRRKR